MSDLNPETPFGCPFPDCTTRSPTQHGINMHMRLAHPTPEQARERAAKKLAKPPRRTQTHDELIERSGAAIDMMFPKIKGSMIPALFKLQEEMIETMLREG